MHLIMDILDFSKIKELKLRVNIIQFRLKEIIEEI